MAKRKKRIPWPDRLLENAIGEPNSGCLLWLGFVNKCGYGWASYHGKPCLTHRIAYELFVGPIPDGMQVLHKCDTPCCIRPDHLFLGTHQDNIADKLAKGRQPTGERHWPAKLTAEQVEEIMKDKRPQKEIGSAFGIEKSHVSRIQCGKVWKHLGLTPARRRTQAWVRQ